MIEIHKINESYFRVFSTFMIEQEIKDFFTFKVPGYQFSPKYRARLWDGNISLYDQKTKKLPCGLYELLISFAKDSGYEVEFKESEEFSSAQDLNEVTLDEIKDYVDSLNVASKRGPIAVREYQYQAIHKAIKNKRTVLVSPTSSGKSLIIYCALRWILDQDPEARVILMVPNIQLVTQMFSDFEEYSLLNDFDVSKHFQKLYGGKSKVLSHSVLISTWQSLSSITKDREAAAQLF
jgi:type I site-specific restriction endonuclease